jgi:ferredoxin
MDCVENCPVDCFYEGENFLVISPDECIDCGICVADCPVDAIVPDNALESDELEKWFDINEKYSAVWPNITVRRAEDVPVDATEWNGVEQKYENYFSENPGKGG